MENAWAEAVTNDQWQNVRGQISVLKNIAAYSDMTEAALEQAITEFDE